MSSTVDWLEEKKLSLLQENTDLNPVFEDPNLSKRRFQKRLVFSKWLERLHSTK